MTITPDTLTMGQLVRARRSEDLADLARQVLSATLERDRERANAALQALCDALNALACGRDDAITPEPLTEKQVHDILNPLESLTDERVRDLFDQLGDLRIACHYALGWATSSFDPQRAEEYRQRCRQRIYGVVSTLEAADPEWARRGR